MKRKNWYKLDNAAQLFPMISNQNDTNNFRLACLLKENVDPETLKEALIVTLKRFPTFCVKLKKGYFWYYLEKNSSPPTVKEESPYFCESNNHELQNGYPFNLCYNGRRISIEIFHALSDGNGGMEFFKSIIFNYLKLKNYDITNKGEVLTEDVETLIDESEDSFIYNYDNKIRKTKNEGKAYQIEGTKYYNNWIGIIHAICDVQSLKAASKKYNATITEYLSSIYLYSLYTNYIKSKKSKHPIRLFIPVNIRKYFKSKTLRNFALFIRTNTTFSNNPTFEEILTTTKETFKKELSQEKMLARIKANIALEKNPLVRIAPLFIKKFIMKIGYKILGSNANTMSFTNLGTITMPKECEDYIERFEFGISANKATPINCAALSYNDTFVLTFSSCLIERKFQQFVIQKLIEDNVNIVIETNDLEVEHEKM